MQRGVLTAARLHQSEVEQGGSGLRLGSLRLSTARGSHGNPGTSWLQTLVGMVFDGKLGPKTVEAINRRSMSSRLFEQLLAVRIRFYGDIISGNRSQAVFAKGRLNRVTSFLDG
jgi:hypothetical protein